MRLSLVAFGVDTPHTQDHIVDRPQGKPYWEERIAQEIHGMLPKIARG